ncbi:IS3 family transposase [Janibacter indicus]|uniref:IS3 family transposase n=1 Tax=Janibacter indicus TaxID=857417 RepID=A0A7L9J0V8_9MICO|nr:IS3 family transposase [Janibacter indicus]QOK22767.1 IS3 family transposase [Janibacter indicus]
MRICSGGARPPLTDVDAFIDDHRDEHGVEPTCTVLAEAGIQVAPSLYYARKKRAPSPRARRDAVLDERLVTVHEDNMGVYGVRKMWKTINRLHPGERVARCTVERRMRALGLAGVSNARSTRTTRPAPAADARPQDKVNRDFTAALPDQRWVADITYVPTWAGFCYVAFVMDLFSRRIVGWRVSTSLRTDLALDALEHAIWTRQRDQRDLAQLIHHSDHGCQYLSIRYTERLAEAEIEASVGSVGDSFDCEHRDCATTWGLTLAYDRPCGCPRVDVSAPGGGVHQAAGRVGSDLIGA